MAAMTIKTIIIFLCILANALEIKSAGALPGACWQRTYEYNDYYNNRFYAPYPCYRGAFIP